MFIKRVVVAALLIAVSRATLPANQVESLFNRADEYVRALPKKGPLSAADRLEMYANFKLATVGPHSEFAGPVPSLREPERLLKYNSWKLMGDKSADQAKRDYIAKLDALAPGWRD